MLNSPDLEAELRKGREAAMLLEHPLLVAAFEDMRKGLYKAWVDSHPSAKEERELCFVAMKLLERLHGSLQQHMLTGQFAAQQLLLGEKSNVNH